MGTGSSVHDLVGDDIMMPWTSSSVQTSNSVRDVDAGRDGAFVGGLRAVLARTDFNLSSKKLMKSSAVRVAAGNAGASSHRKMFASDRQSFLVLPRSVATRSLSQRTQHHRKPRSLHRCAYGGSASRACDTDDAWRDTRRQTTVLTDARNCSPHAPAPSGQR